jgi:outer membrane protein assembly factor BamB
MRTGHAAPGARPLAALPKELRPVWRIPTGPGFSSPVVAGGKLVYLDEQNGREVAHLLEAATGQELWRVDYAPSVSDEWGSGPRSTPILQDDRVYVQSRRGEFRCLTLAEGRIVWGASFEQDFGVKFHGASGREGTASRRGNSGSGVIDGDRIVLPVGGTNGASLVCFNRHDGRVLWKTGGDEAAYSSLMIATLAGVRQGVAFTADALCGADLQTGRMLWRRPLHTAAKRHVATPVIRGDTVMVNSHTFGLICLRISPAPGGLTASEAWWNKAQKINLSTLVLVGDHLYGQGADRDYVCVEAGTGRLKWSQPGFGQSRRDNASTIALGHQLLILTEDGTLVLAEANPAQYTERGRLQVCGTTWSFPAYSDGKLFVRDPRQLLCVELAPQ